VERGQGNANVAIVMSLYDAFRSGDNVTPFEIYDRDIVWRVNVLDMPDVAEVVYGHDGVREFWRAWLSAWEQIEFDLVAVDEIEDGVVIVEMTQLSRGRSSGVEVPSHWFQVWRLRAGKVIASYGRKSREEVLTVAGVEAAT
jgi:ketosteroid isomerase-like protein